jgi:hypothetical protein
MSRKPKGFWRALDLLAGGAVMAEWTRELGDELERAQPLLRLLPDLAASHPCMNVLGCGEPHRAEETEPGRWEAVCGPEVSCPPFRLERRDLFVFGLDTTRLCSRVAGALGLGVVNGRGPGQVRAEVVGSYGAAGSPVCLMLPGDSARMMREVERLFCAQLDPFVLLTPTGAHCSPDVETMLRRQFCMHIALSSAVVLGAGGALTATTAVGPLLAEFVRRCGDGRGLVKTVERVDRNLEAVAKGNYELKREVDELRQFQADGFFKFALRVDGDDFRAFAGIMALGNRKAAADFLEVPHRSFYDRVDKWSARGKEYQTLVRWIEWRKRSGRKIKLRLEDSVQSGEPNDVPENPETVGDVLDTIKADDNRDYPAILGQVMEALRAQNPKNWAAVRDEVVEMIKEEVPG